MGISVQEYNGRGEITNSLSKYSTDVACDLPEKGDHLAEVEWVHSFYTYDTDVLRALKSMHRLYYRLDGRPFLEDLDIYELVTESAAYAWLVFCTGLFHIDVLRTHRKGLPLEAPNIRGIQPGNGFFRNLWVLRNQAGRGAEAQREAQTQREAETRQKAAEALTKAQPQRRAHASRNIKKATILTSGQCMKVQGGELQDSDSDTYSEDLCDSMEEMWHKAKNKQSVKHQKHYSQRCARKAAARRQFSTGRRGSSRNSF